MLTEKYSYKAECSMENSPYIEDVGGFFSDRSQIVNLPLTPTMLFHIIHAVNTTRFFGLGV